MKQNLILSGKKQLGPYPMEKLKRVEKPTTKITDNINRVDERESGFNRAFRGDFGPVALRERHRPMKYPAAAAEADIARHLALTIDGKVAGGLAPLPEDPQVLSRHIKALGYFLRADIMTISALPQYAVYSHDNTGKPVELNHKYAILISVDQNYETMDASSGHDWISNSQSHMSYSTTAFISCVLADYIRRLGYPARAHHCGHYDVVIPPLLLLSGMGEMSRLGNTVLNPFLGARFKSAAVTTDLPLMPDKPVDFGLQKFCEVCGKCAEACPSGAITTGGKTMHNGYESWPLDVEKCTRFRVANPHGASCGTCIKVCPWNKPAGSFHDMVRWTVEHKPWFNGMFVEMDSMFGFDKKHGEKQWWFDFEDIGGIIRNIENKNENINEGVDK